MKRVFFAWELGSNLGHLSRDLPLARRCLEAGYEVVWAVPDLGGAQRTVGDEPFKLVQSPLLNAPKVPPRPPANYSDMLLNAGYGDPAVLRGAIRAWRSLLELAGSDAMVFNHAPTALIAARIHATPTLVTGTGFEVPPPVSPLPAFRPWSPASLATLTDLDERLLNAINTEFAESGVATLNNLGELTSSNCNTLTTFPELDPFGPRVGANYIGPLFSLQKALPVHWTSARGPRVFAYVRQNLDGADALLMALDALDAEVVCFMPGVTAEWCARFKRLRFFGDPVDIEKLLMSADLAITSGAGTIATALLAGVPALAVPQVLEQRLAAARLTDLGAGLSAGDRRTPSLFGAMLHQLLTRSEFKSSAAGFAARHRDYTLTRALQTQFDALQAVLGVSAEA